MTEEEKIICKQFLHDADKTHSCNEYKLLMNLIEQEPTKNDLGVDVPDNNVGNIDCISRIETIDYLCKHCPDDGECFKDCDEIKHLRQMPSVTPQEPKIGHWIKYDKEYFTPERWTSVIHSIRECSECHKKIADFCGEMKFCLNCGVKMEDAEE